MAIDGDDVAGAAERVAEQIKSSIGHPDEEQLHYQFDTFQTVTGGLFSIATAINRLADAVEGLGRGGSGSSS